MTHEVAIALSVSLSAIFLCAIIFGWGPFPLLPVAGLVVLGALIFGRPA